MDVLELKQGIRKVFDPMAGRLTLVGPVERSFGSTNFHLGYLNSKLGLEIVVEMSDFFVYALIFQHTKDEFPIGYTSPVGDRQKVYVQDALKSLDVDVTEETATLQRLGGDHRNWNQMCEILANLVEKNWPTILRNAERLFPRA